MILDRNKCLIYSVCKVYAKSTSGSAFPILTALKTTLSKIDLRSEASHKDGGILYKNKLNLSYKGVSDTFFSDINTLVNGHFEIIVDTSDAKRYRISNSINPMLVKTKYKEKECKINFYNESFEPFENLNIASNVGNFAYTLTLNL